MPFPWKKVKSARISQLVNDHLHKQRDGSSLVVETGFPTSLIDLFIKNREKLKKPSKKKRRSHPISSSDDISNPAIEESPTSIRSPPPPPPPPSLVGSPAPNRPSSVLASPPSRVSEICVSAKGGAIDDVNETKLVDEKSGDVNAVLVGVLKIFVVVVLALGTKRLTVGITISAVLLLLLEYAAKTAAMPVVQIGKRLLTFKKLEAKSSASRLADQEIEVIESNEFQPEKESVGESSSRERLGFEEIELLEMAMKREESMRDAAEDPKKKSRKARIKSKVQNIVSKKFRRSRKDQEGLILSEEKVEQQAILEQSENGRSISSEDDKICLDHRLSDLIKGEDTKGESEVAVARTYMLLCLIVLSGLIGGRVFALVLTLSCFLLLKLGQKLPRRIKLGNES